MLGVLLQEKPSTFLFPPLAPCFPIYYLRDELLPAVALCLASAVAIHTWGGSFVMSEAKPRTARKNVQGTRARLKRSRPLLDVAIRSTTSQDKTTASQHVKICSTLAQVKRNYPLFFSRALCAVTFIPARARARRADCAPGPGVLVLLPPVARILMCRAVMPSSCRPGTQTQAAERKSTSV